MKGNALVVGLSAPGSADEMACRFDELVERNPESFQPLDEQRLRRGLVLSRMGLLIRMTRDHTCILCGVPIGEGAWRCHACEHRDEGPGYHAGAPRTG